ncbi:MAG: hypothetical protein GY878_07135 [Fuerstiella sp.]|nr:hypothetical protein [Fuerstiella sp.]
MERRQKIDNRGDQLLIVFTEPEAQDYWLKPGDEFEIRAPITDANAQFEISIHEEGITIWPPHEMGYISVWHNDVELGCGHQRPSGWGES